MPKKNYIGLNFDGWTDMASKLEELAGRSFLRETTEKALKKSQKHVTTEIQAAMTKHHRTGRTEGAIHTTNEVLWDGNTASAPIGFDFPEGLASIFLMYGTPRMKKDTQLYNAIYGTKMKKEIGTIQHDIFANAIAEKWEG